MVKILSDSPTGVDSFSSGAGSAGGAGPHERVAASIERRITSLEGGGAIGLQGDLGAGKSTIIEILRSRLSDRADTCFVVFNAWSHVGDPLRRSFLESLIDAVSSKGNWISQAAWQREKDRLAQRSKTTSETKTSSPSGFAISLALATALVPFGLLVAREGLKIATLSLNSELDVSWITVIGFLLLGAPPLVALGNLLRLLSKVPIRSVLNVEHWSFLSQHGTVESTSDTIEESDPTTIEFESVFEKLLSTALAARDRRVVLVIDNLDRLDAVHSLAIWSSLQTFVNSDVLRKEKFSSRFTLLVPFSPTVLEAIWERHDSVTSAQAFFEKTFQVRYDTPPPTITDRNVFVRKLMQEAIPELSTADEDAVLEIIDLGRREGKIRMVPRQLKLFVNQLAILVDMW